MDGSGFEEILQDAGLYWETQVEGNFFPISLEYFKTVD